MSIMLIVTYENEVWGPFLGIKRLKHLTWNLSVIPFHVRSSIWNYVYILGVNKHATNYAARGERGRFPLLFQVMQRSLNFYSRPVSSGENHLRKLACNSNGLWFPHLDQMIGKYQVTTEHQTFGSHTDSASILNKMKAIYGSLWYQNITRSADLLFNQDIILSRTVYHWCWYQ